MPAPTHNQPEYTVSEISGELKRVVESNFAYVRVRGELSGVKRAASGHLYLDLKDEKAVLSGVCWKGKAASLAFKPEDGLEVIAIGKLSTYPGRSNYQLIIDSMEPAGAGALMALLEQRKKALAAEGLFAAERKQPLPFMPQTIGVVTSPTGAVIRDILHRLADRFPVEVFVWPVKVQGEGAAEEIAAAIAGFNAMPTPPELLIVARGGGSIEDLWCFNEEIVVRAAAASRIALISAVGHETDTTLIDYVSDRRAPTPTAAAEIAVPVRREWMLTLSEWQMRMQRAALQRLERQRDTVTHLARAIPAPQQALNHQTQRLDDWSERLARALPQRVEHAAQQLSALTIRLTPALMLQRFERAQELLRYAAEGVTRAITHQLDSTQSRLQLPASLLETLNYRQVLRRGFALVKAADGSVVTRAQQAKRHGSLELVFDDDALKVTTSNAKPKTSKKVPPEQSSLFDA